MSETPNKEDELAGTEQPFVQHLMELRDRLVKAMIAIAIAAAILFFFPGPGALYDFLAAPLVAHLPKGATLIATSVISPFMVPLKILLMSAFLLALPFVLWQIWAFEAPGLYSHEKKLVLPLVISSTLLSAEGLPFLVMGTLVGGVLAALTLAISVISIPLLLDRDVNAVTAVLASLKAVARNPLVMIGWGALVTLFIGAGIAVAYVGLLITFPLIGFASWHAYRDLVEIEEA